jgi:hypothetical protein
MNNIPANHAESDDDTASLDLIDSDRKAPVDMEDITLIKPRQDGTLWTVLQKWILALPTTTDKERLRRKQLQKELEKIVVELDDGEGLGEGGVSPKPSSGHAHVLTVVLARFRPLRFAVRQCHRPAP